MEDKKEYQQNFDRIFSAYRGKKIAVYGTGQNAWLIAECVSDYEIIGFISRDGTEGMLSGQTILSIGEAVKAADIILIAATASSTRIVYSRIKELVPPETDVLDLYGERLNGSGFYAKNAYWKKNPVCLRETIDQYAVVSFDVFDTLIMRRVLKPEDIFEMAGDGCGLGIPKEEFKVWRMGAERNCSLTRRAPSFSEIYEELKNEHHLNEETVQQMKQSETEQERACVAARGAVAEAYRYALSRGKKVYFTSDMYFTSGQIRELLGQCGIEEGYELLVSCELHASKRDGGLYGKLKERAGEERILHIGDHPVIDGEMAEKNGVDSFTVLSAYDLLASSSFVQVFDSLRTEDDRNYLGYFASVMLNDPFALSEYGGKFFLSSYKDIALAVYPMTMMFFHHIVRHAKRYDCILFPSRDGYFLCRLYNRLRESRKDLGLPEGKYIYASRMALSRAAACDEESFRALLDKLFSDHLLNCKDYILNQFDYELPEEYDSPSGKLLEMWGKEGLIRKLKAYYPEIEAKLERHKSAYLEYLDALDLKRYRWAAMVDVVSYGTQAYCLSRMLNREIDLLALGTTDVPNVYVDNPERVFSVYGNINKKAGGAVYSCSNLSVAHLLLELLYASTDGQFMGISEDQKPLFQSGTGYNPGLVRGVQGELVRIMEETGKLGFCYENISKEFSMGMIQLLFRKYSELDEELRKRFAFSDPYMGGMKRVNLMDMF